ncbi:MAG: peptidoglycan DD-metalloendopeptidase family protein [Longimicrobiales bacterium]
MNRTPAQRYRAVLVLAGVLGLAALVGRTLASETPEVGPLHPVVAAPAEVMEDVRLRSGETFGEALQAASLGWSEQNALLLAFREQANPRRIREGTRITFRWLRDREWLRGVDVSLNRDETLRLTRDEVGWSSTLVNTPLRVDTLYVSGVIRSSLWNAVIDNEQISHLTAPDRALFPHLMDKVFQWQIDFSRQVQTGDTYRFALEGEFRPDGTMRDNGTHIIAAEFVNGGTAYRAIWFDPDEDGVGEYYDEAGTSVQKAFLLKPLEFRRISSRVNANRLHPVHGYRRPHNGVDYAANTGTPIMATGDGVVVSAGWKGELGNCVEIRHANRWLTRYGHLNGFAAGIRAGTRVSQSQVIGYVGMTGTATGPHLHYEMRASNGAVKNPLDIDLPPGEPVPADARGRWALESIERLQMLQPLPGPPIELLAEAPAPDAEADGSAAGGD